MYEEMKQAGLAPDTVTFGTLFSLCAAARQGHCALQVGMCRAGSRAGGLTMGCSAGSCRHGCCTASSATLIRWLAPASVPLHVPSPPTNQFPLRLPRPAAVQGDAAAQGARKRGGPDRAAQGGGVHPRPQHGQPVHAHLPPHGARPRQVREGASARGSSTDQLELDRR